MWQLEVQLGDRCGPLLGCSFSEASEGTLDWRTPFSWIPNSKEKWTIGQRWAGYICLYAADPVIIGSGSRGVWFIEVLVGLGNKEPKRGHWVSGGKPSLPYICSSPGWLWVSPPSSWSASIAMKEGRDNHWWKDSMACLKWNSQEVRRLGQSSQCWCLSSPFTHVITLP